MYLHWLVVLQIILPNKSSLICYPIRWHRYCWLPRVNPDHKRPSRSHLRKINKGKSIWIKSQGDQQEWIPTSQSDRWHLFVLLGVLSVRLGQCPSSLSNRTSEVITGHQKSKASKSSLAPTAVTTSRIGCVQSMHNFQLFDECHWGIYDWYYQSPAEW